MTNIATQMKSGLSSKDYDIIEKILYKTRAHITALERILTQYDRDLDSRGYLATALNDLLHADGAFSMYHINTNVE